MSEATEQEFSVPSGELRVRTWEPHDPAWIALVVHGYGEHSGRYGWVADQLVAARAVVCAPDHVGHGHSPGERALIEHPGTVLADLDAVLDQVAARHPGLPLVLIGHSMGGMFAVRYAQLHRDKLAALVLSAPVLGTWHVLDLLELEIIPETPIDPTSLSRDPRVGVDYAEDPLVWHGPFKRPTLETVDRCLEDIGISPALGVPTLWLHGEDDDLVPEADTRHGIDQVRGEDFFEHIYPGARHELFNETNRAEVLEDVVTFVGRALSS
ncbi:lysophospholipase [Saccharopolyspora cebuensis]|uniref:Lysophospholipase n=1 Tax=Saccharopolyspora cebuensis TaxID=418759 RepID=A0ABV4CH83_9PSEU